MGIRMALLDLMPAAWKHGELLRASQKGCEELAELLGLALFCDWDCTLRGNELVACHSSWVDLVILTLVKPWCSELTSLEQSHSLTVEISTYEIVCLCVSSDCRLTPLFTNTNIHHIDCGCTSPRKMCCARYKLHVRFVHLCGCYMPISLACFCPLRNPYLYCIMYMQTKWLSHFLFPLAMQMLESRQMSVWKCFWVCNYSHQSSVIQFLSAISPLLCKLQFLATYLLLHIKVKSKFQY